MNKIEKENAKEIALMEQEKSLAEAGVDIKGKIYFPEYWSKRRDKLSKKLIKELQETANRKPEVTDEYGEYKQGTFLHRAFVVTVTRELDCWQCHIFSDRMPVTLPIIRELRDKFIPDYCVMVQFFQSRAERDAIKGVVLCEIPGSTVRDDDSGVEAVE